MKELCKRLGIKGAAICSILLLLLSLSFAGCKTDDDDDAATSAPESPVPAADASDTPLTFEFTEAGMFFIGDPWSTLKYRKNDGNVMRLPATISASAAATKLGVDIEEDETFLRDDAAYVIIDVAAGDKLYLYALTCENDDEEDVFMTLNATADCYVYGNMMSLLSYENGNWNPACTTVPKDAFLYLFYYDEHFMNHSSEALSLPATTLAERCYKNMFLHCEKITKAPELPATSLAANCYKYMFMDSGLTEAPALPATTLAAECYCGMFAGCENLTRAPAIPATTLQTSCYSSMFSGCTNLAAAPDLPATALADHCYQYMFHDCESLTAAPALPATTLTGGCYYGMFEGCSLVTAPALPATDLTDCDYCYWEMFCDCSSLTTAPALPAEKLCDWCYTLMFSGCSALTTAPALPATTLTDFCYSDMFSGCTSLTAAPVLPAATLAEACYSEMFNGCSQLASVTCLATDMTADRCTEYWLTNVAASGTFTKATGAAWESGSDGVPSGWTVEDYSE